MRDSSDFQIGVLARLGQMLLGWGSVGLAYGLASIMMGAPSVLPMTALDQMIPFSASAVWIYLSFFVLIPYSYLHVDAARLRWLRRSMQLAALICGAVFLLWPTTLAYPVVQGTGASVTLLRWLTAADSPQNCLPSLHGALTLLCVWALCDRRQPWRSAAALAAGLAIGVSIIALRRHLSIDLGAGIAVGVCCGLVCRTHFARHEQSLELVR